MNLLAPITWRMHSWSGAHLKDFGWEQRGWQVVVRGVDGVMIQYLLILKINILDPR